MNTEDSIANRHPVLFVGAGPGDPELITVKGQKALMAADVVIFAGSLVPEALLTWTRSGAARISSADMHLDEIVSTMTAAYEAGKRVVRLHTGDPGLFGAVFEQMAELQQRAIPYRVIPGVTAAFAASAAMGIEYTLPEICQTLILTRMGGRTPVPESEQLESLARHRASMAIYLSAGLAEPVAEILKTHYGQKAACAVAYRVSQPQEKIVMTTLDGLVAAIRREKIDRHALIIIGRVLAVQPAALRHKSKLYDREFSHGYRK